MYSIQYVVSHNFLNVVLQKATSYACTHACTSVISFTYWNIEAIWYLPWQLYIQCKTTLLFFFSFPHCCLKRLQVFWLFALTKIEFSIRGIISLSHFWVSWLRGGRLSINFNTRIPSRDISHLRAHSVYLQEVKNASVLLWLTSTQENT